MIYSPRKRDIIILVGNTVDHFDSSLYIFLAPIIAPVFFSNTDKLLSLIMAYGILATSIITKPLGTYLFGMIARLKGPVVALSNSLIGVGVFTLFLGLLPGHATMGWVAPLLFVTFRVLREVYAAGETSIAKLYILENKIGKEAFKGSYLYQVSTMLGIILASLAATIVHYIDITGSWRICHILGGVAAIIGYFLRQVTWPKENRNLNSIFKFYGFDGLRILWINKLNLLRIAIVTGFSHMTYLIPFVTMNHMVPMITNIQEKTMLAVNSFMLIFDMVSIPLIGKLVSGYNPNQVMQIASTILALSIVPLWYFIADSSIYYVTFVRFWIVMWGVVYMCPLNLWCKTQIRGEEKYMIVGMGSTFGASTIGKLTPFICLTIVHYTGSYLPIALYIMIVFILAGIVIRNSTLLPENIEP
jgi:MFS family permease